MQMCRLRQSGCEVLYPTGCDPVEPQPPRCPPMNASALQHTSIYQRALDESEESDGEGGLGNLNRLVVRPPGHSGKAKRGHLCFDAAYESGNLGRADYVSELEYDLFVRPDTCRPRSRLWFYFSVDNARQDQRVIFNFVNFGKEWNLFATEMTPLVRSTSRPKWQRIPRRYVFYHRSSAHRGRRVLSLAFAFDREDDVFQFATAAPYSYSRLQAHLDSWAKRARDSHIVTRELLANTTQKRRVDLLIIGSSEDKGNEKAKVDDERKMEMRNEIDGEGRVKQRVVLVIARAHGGEPPASYVCQGFLDFMISSNERARALRQSVRVLVVPMLNPDGVFLGNQRSDLLGADLNRAWNTISSWAHPALYALRARIKKIVADKSSQLDFVLDLHAHISREGVFMYGNSYDDVYRFERHAVLAKAVAAKAEAWRGDGCCYNSDPRKAGSARRTLAALALRTDSYSLLVSLGGRRLAAHGPYMHYTEDAYIRVGRSLAKALYDYYQHAGVAAAASLGPATEPRERRNSRRRGRRSGGARSARPAVDHPIEVAGAARQCVAQRTLSPTLPPREPPAAALPPAQSLRLRPRESHAVAKGDTRLLQNDMLMPSIVPEVMGFSLDCPRRVRLSVLDVNSSVRERARLPRPPRPRRPRKPRVAAPPARPAITSDDYDTADTADTAADTDGSY